MATFPTTPVPNYPVEIEPEWTTLVSMVDTGGEQRKQKSLFPRYNVKLTYKTLTPAELQTLWSFYMARKGSYEAFYIYDLISLVHYAEYIGTGDGSTYIFDIPGSNTQSQVIYKNGIELTEDVDYNLLIGGGESSSDRVRFITINEETFALSLLNFNLNIYAGTSPGGRLFKWNGSSAWTQVAAQLGSETTIYNLEEFSSELYGGTSPGGRLFKYLPASSAWTQVVAQLNSQTTIYSLKAFNSELYAGTSPGGRLFKYNSASSAWTQVAAQLGSETRIYSLIEFNSELYGGTYPGGRLFKWNGSSAWTQVAPKLGSEDYILSLVVYNSNLYGGTSPGGRLFKWNGVDSWELIADELQNPPTAGNILTCDFNGLLRMRVRFQDDMMNRQMFYRALYTTGLQFKGLKPA